MTTIKTNIYNYRYDISKPKEKALYEKERLKAQKASGLNEPDTYHYINFQIYKGSDTFIKDKIKPLKVVHIETEHLFNNQFNTTEGLRVFLWSEIIFPNKDIKEGYYIVFNEDLKDALNNTFKCGYCGKQYTKEQHKNLSFCSNCLDSEYLKKDDLFLLRLKAISDTTERQPLNDCDKEALIKAYTEAQIKGTSERGIKRIKAKRESLLSDRDKTIKNANTEYNGFIWLLDRGINIDNCIYYNHINTFCFGWRNKLSFEVEQELKTLLNGFPFTYELKV